MPSKCRPRAGEGGVLPLLWTQIQPNPAPPAQQIPDRNWLARGLKFWVPETREMAQ